MSDEPEDATQVPEDKRRRGLGDRIREHLQAAEVAAEESAGYGWVTEAVEATEAAVNPDHELGEHERGARRPEDAAEGDASEGSTEG